MSKGHDELTLQQYLLARKMVLAGAIDRMRGWEPGTAMAGVRANTLPFVFLPRWGVYAFREEDFLHEDQRPGFCKDCHNA